MLKMFIKSTCKPAIAVLVIAKLILINISVQEWRGAEQASLRRDDRPGRRAAQHPGGLLPKKSGGAGGKSEK